MLKVILTEDADATLEDIIHYYLTEHSTGRAAKVVQSVDLAFEQISKAPLRFPKCLDILEPDENVRQIVVHSTFRIIYRIKPDYIQIIEIFHGNRNDQLLKDIK